MSSPKMGIKVYLEKESDEIVKIEFQKKGKKELDDLRTDLVVSKEGRSKLDELDEIAELKPLKSSMDPHKIIDGSLSLLTGALTVGFAFAPATGIAALMALGGLIAAGLKLAISKKDISEEQFGLVVKQLKAFDEKITHRFEEMEKFLLENSFGFGVISLVSTLKQFMMDAITESVHEATMESTDKEDILLAEERKQKAIDNFRNRYKKETALNIGYMLWAFMAKDLTNPLILTILDDGPHKDETEKKKEERLKKRREYYEKWKKTIRDLLSELQLIEYIAAGMFKNQNKHDYEMLDRLSEEIELVMDRFEEKHKIGEWYHFKHVVLPSNTQKLDKMVFVIPFLVPYLHDTFPESAFAIVTHTTYDKFGDLFYYRCPDKWHLADCNKKKENEKFSVLVYRIKKATKFTKEVEDEMTESMKSLMKQKTLFKDDMRSTLNRNILVQKKTVNGIEKNLIRQDGLVLAMSAPIEYTVGFANKLHEFPGVVERFHLGPDEKTHQSKDVTLVVTIA